MLRPFPLVSGPPRMRVISLLAVLLLGLNGCVYSFTGGGLPRHIRTVAVLPFENATAQPLIGTELQSALREELPRSLGVRLVDEDVADAVVRGRITGFRETAQNIRPGDANTNAQVFQREVRITFEAEIYDRTEDRAIWQASSLSGVGTYQPDQEDFTVGRAQALEDLVQKVINGAQSQW